MLANTMVVHFNVLGPGVKDMVLRELDVVEVVAIDRRRVRHLRLSGIVREED